MNDITKDLLASISAFGESLPDAYSIREDGACAARQSTEHIRIEDKKGAPGLVVRVAPGTKGETVAVPACVTHGGVIVSMLAQRGIPKYPPEHWMADAGCGYELHISPEFWMRDGVAEVVDIIPYGYLDAKPKE